ncbi:MAG TPA: Ig-like domain-containing protein [Candidatus Acidoferrales bacterium]
MNVLPNRNIFRNYFSALTAILCVLGFFAPIAGAAVVPGNTLPLYMVHHNDNNIDTLDPLTGQAITTVPITLAGVGVTGGFWGLDQQPGTGTLFAIWKRTELVTINPTTGAMVDIGPIGHNVGGITFATIGSTPTLYMVTGASDETNPDTLYTLNTSTGAATLVLAFATGNNLGETIAFNPFDGMLYRLYGSGTIGVNQFMVSVNPNTLAVTNIPLTGDTYNQATSLTHWTGNVLLMAGHDSNLYLVTTAGNVTNVAPLNAGDGDTKGLVFTGAPAPCTPLAALYGAANSASGETSFLYSINPANGTPTLIGPMGFGLVGGIRFNAGGTLFGTGQTVNNSFNLYTITPCTGGSSLVGSLQLGGLEFQSTADISFRASDGTLFAYLKRDGSDGLGTVNTTTGATTSVTTYDGSGSGDGIAFSSTGTLFNAFGTNLETINLSTNDAMTLVAAFGFPNIFVANSSAITAMDFQPNTGTLFGAVSTAVVVEEDIAAAHSPIRNGGPPTAPANFLVTINTTSGAVSSVGETELGMNSIAFSPAVALPPASITATGGTPQSAVIEAEFATPLQATVKDSNSNPVAGVTVTFTAPSTGATAFFQGGANTAVTNASGVATSVNLFAGDTAGGPYNVAATVVGVATPANFALTNTVGQPEQIIIKTGTPQTATVTTAFALPLSVTVEDGGGNPVPGVTITFTPPSTGASGTFAGGNTAVSNSSGIATSGTFTANGTSGGPYNVFASLPEEGSPEFRAATVHPEGFATQVTFSLKNVDYSVTPTTTTQTVAPGATANYSLTFTAIAGNSVNPTTFSCTGLPSLSTCTFNPTSLPANSPTTPFTLAISTTAPGTATNVGPANKLVGPLKRPVVLTLFAMLALMLGLFVLPKRRFARLRVSAVSVFGFAALLLLTSYISGCGSTGSGFPLANNNPGTPAGTFTVTIVGTSGSVQRTTTVTLVVQ